MPASLFQQLTQSASAIGREPVEASDSRAFGWPTGTVRAVLALALVTFWAVGTIVSYALDGPDGAQMMASILSAPAGTAIGFYYMKKEG